MSVLLLLLLYQLPDDSSDESESRPRQEWGDDDRCQPERPPVSSESDAVEEDVPEVPAPAPAAPTVSVRPVRRRRSLVVVTSRTVVREHRTVPLRGLCWDVSRV